MEPGCSILTGLRSVKVKRNSEQLPTCAGKCKVGAGRQKKSPEGFTKHPRFWYPDGNLQVQIERVRFNLHRSRLVGVSHWFDEYFEVDDKGSECDEDDHGDCSHDEDEDDDADDSDVTVDGPEVVRLDETTAEPEVVELDDTGVDITDFERLISAMDDIVTYHHSPPPFATLASIYRAATVLGFCGFRTYAHDAIKALFPDSFKDVHAETIPHAAEVIILAREWPLPCVLKRAFYELARSLLTAKAASALKLLAPADIVLVARAQRRLAAEWHSMYAPPQCDVCARSATTKHADILWFMSMSAKYQFDPILGLAMLQQEYAKQKHYCPVCAPVREEGWRTHTLKIWKTDLNVWFRLA